MNTQNNACRSRGMHITTFETVLFAMLGAIMFLSKVLMEALPNIHLLGTLTVTYTLVYRKKALIPIYVYVLLNGLIAGFNTWWIPYLYIWTVLWGVTMLLPRHMPDRIGVFVYPLVSCIHGLLFGVLYAPVQALVFGLSLEGTLAWIAAGFTFDLIHGIGNLVLGVLIIPLCRLLKRLNRIQAHS